MIVIVTGGSSGLGEAITRKFAAADPENKIYFTYNQSETNAKKIESDFSNAFAIKCDFKNEDDVNSLKDKLIEIDPDVLINNAYSGGFIKSYFHKTPPTDFLNDFKENLIPTIVLTQAGINCFRKKKNGKIITILTSALLNIPPTGASVYVANKAYLAQMSKVWASENTKYNITSNTVSPSFMQTNFTTSVDERIVEQMKENHPLKKLLTTGEVAESVFFLANASNQINGIDLVINAASDIR